MIVKRFDVYLVNLDPTIGSEIQKTRPCVVISPDENCGADDQQRQVISDQSIVQVSGEAGANCA
jgi:PemK-like, MazF-like toxin of type II toxin-antitoxin system